LYSFYIAIRKSPSRNFDGPVDEAFKNLIRKSAELEKLKG